MSATATATKPCDYDRTSRTKPAKAASSGERAQRELLSALRSVAKGDFSIRLSTAQPGIDGDVAEAFNDSVTMNARLLEEVQRISDVVGRDGRIAQRASLPTAPGAWSTYATSVNELIDDLTHRAPRRAACWVRSRAAISRSRWCSKSTAGHSKASFSAPARRSTRWSISSTRTLTSQVRNIAELTTAVANGGPHRGKRIGGDRFARRPLRRRHRVDGHHDAGDGRLRNDSPHSREGAMARSLPIIALTAKAMKGDRETLSCRRRIGIYLQAGRYRSVDRPRSRLAERYRLIASDRPPAGTSPPAAVTDLELQLLLDAVQRISGHDFREYAPATCCGGACSSALRAENAMTISGSARTRAAYVPGAMERFVDCAHLQPEFAVRRSGVLRRFDGTRAATAAYVPRTCGCGLPAAARATMRMRSRCCAAKANFARSHPDLCDRCLGGRGRGSMRAA